MGITGHSINLIDKAIIHRSLTDRQAVLSVIELGAQNMYDQTYETERGPYASTYYRNRGMKYNCIDLNGENAALKLDLEKSIKHDYQYDLVTNFGTSEHIKNQHAVFGTIHKLTKVGGMIICENPKTGNWPQHGLNYYTQEFYQNLCKALNYTLVEVGEYPAMGNKESGWNIYAIMKKTEAKVFPTEKQFDKFGIKDK